MTIAKWRRLADLIVTRHGIAAVCPYCGAHVLITDIVDLCPCGAELRVAVEVRKEPRMGNLTE